jgi:hypothetical protein
MLPHSGIRYKEQKQEWKGEPRSGVNIFFKCGLLNGLQGKKNTLGETGVGGRIKLKWISKKQRFNWLP